MNMDVVLTESMVRYMAALLIVISKIEVIMYFVFFFILKYIFLKFSLGTVNFVQYVI